MKIMEVGPRDGLQNETNMLDTEIKKLLIMGLIGAGLKWIEATSFVSKAAIPQLKDADQLFPSLPRQSDVIFPVLVPNEKGLDRALAVGATHIAIFLSASDTFSQRNIHISMPESVRLYEGLTKLAKKQGLWVRGYISCVMGCPYEGDIDPRAVVMLAERMRLWGVDEISLGDTIGVGTPKRFHDLLVRVKDAAPLNTIAVHCHDTYGQALANILTAVNMGVSIIDSSVGGLGGCPYAQGATGNVATEDVVYMLQGMGIETGVDLTRLAQTGEWICKTIGRDYAAKAGKAWLRRGAG